MSGVVDLHAERLARIERKAAPDPARCPRELLQDTREMVARLQEMITHLERIVATEDQFAENIAAARARHGFHLVT